ncbi:hypothetical protein P885DRAFT_79886 [Corynascus similis CBS 632.67]
MTKKVDDDGFIDVNWGPRNQEARLKKKEEYSGVRCYWRIYCERGLGCKYGQTKAVQEYFSVYGNRKGEDVQAVFETGLHPSDL